MTTQQRERGKVTQMRMREMMVRMWAMKPGASSHSATVVTRDT